MIIKKITLEIDNANERGTLQNVLEKYEVNLESNFTVPVNTRTMKIIVFGMLAGKKKDYQIVLKKLNIDLRNVDFVDDYAELKRYSVASLKHSNVYSDILIGPIPHCQVSMGDTSSFLATIKRNPSDYPRLQEMLGNGKLKIAKTNFEEAICKTRYFEALNQS